MRVPSLVVAGSAAALATFAMCGPWAGALHGLSFDTLQSLRHATFGPQYAPVSSPSVVIAIDEETYRREPFETTPKVMWTNEIGQVIDAVMDGGALVLGFDVILPTSVAGQIRGFDRPFLQVLNRHARDGRIVLGKVQHSLKPILPSPGQRFAVGHNDNIRSTNLFTDDDGIVRGAPVTLTVADATPEAMFEPSLSAELAARALKGRLAFDPAGQAMRDGRPVPTIGANNLLINFDDNQTGIPTYSLADLQACAAGGKREFFERHFAGKVVLLGSVLDVEDRKLTALRYAMAPDAAAFGRRCIHEPLQGLLQTDLARDGLPGVYVHAFAINNYVRGNFLARPAVWVAWLAVYGAALAVGTAVLWLPAAAAGAIAGLGALAWSATATAAFAQGLVLPLFEPVIAAAAAFAMLAVYRFAIADRDKRVLRRMFGLYLAPAVIEQMVERGDMPSLGGESRVLTIYFSDLSGFTSFSEGMAPEALVRLLNTYLSAMTDIIEAHGGFVDKYVGDAIIAVFGAPHDDPAHAGNAVRAALACDKRLAALNDELAQAPDRRSNGARLSQRIGLNTGRVLVGNIGSQRRFNYTVMGDAVNLASRLEGAGKVYGTRILVSEETARQCADAVTFREVDRVRVVGRDEPVRIFEPLGAGDQLSEDGLNCRDVYEKGLAAYRAGAFAAAIANWEPIAAFDPVAGAMAKRADELAANRPAAWDGIYSLGSK